jgi:hypothetical protein
MPNSFNTPITTDSIRVGYVDPTLGYVTDITICEANDYAYKNPGTVFVFRDGRNNIKYLTINEVNKLTPNDIVSTASTCGGFQEVKECGPPKIQIFGGGGVGAVGNPIVGEDGAILAVDLVSGGFGYQFPPITQAKDECQYGTGAVLRAVLGETVEAYETFEGEEDFEEYELCDDTSVGYGIKYGPNGENLGNWDPDSYTSATRDPIQNEIEKYQESLTKYKNPFWTTRKKLPIRISSLDKDFSSYEVTFPAWNDFMNSYAISPVPPSNVPGSDFAGRIFTFEWEENFPYDGEYIFRGLCDNLAKLYIDGDLIADLKGFNDSVQPIQKTLKSGVYLIRIDLLNIPVITNTPTTSVTSKINANFIKRGNDFYLDVTGSGTGEVELLMEINDSSYIAGLAAKEVIIPSDKGKVKFTRATGTPKAENIKKTIDVTGGKSYGPIQILGATIGVKSPSLNSNKIALYDAAGTDENIKFIITDIKSDKTTTSSSATANVASITTQNTKDYVIPEAKIIEKKGQYYIQVGGTGKVTITFKMDVNDADYIAGIAASEIRVPSESGTISLKRNTYLPNAYEKEEVVRKSGKFTGGKTYGPIEIIDQNPTGLPPKLSGSKKLELRDAEGDDANIKFEIDRIEAQKSTVSNVVAGTVVSSKSWNQNPMGISVTIDAPPQPVPQEQPPVQEGRCPPNPIWSTRFPSAKENWYPVRFPEWSKFLNRYALSPVKPLDTPGSDSGGISYSNSWTVNAPFRGYYKVRGEVDDIAKIYVDGNLVLDLSRRVGKTSGSEKVLLEEGNHVIKVEVENYSSESSSKINQKIFSTLDWQSPLSSAASNIKAKFIRKGKDYYLDVSGSGSGEISFVMDINDASYIAGLAAKEVIIPSDGGKLTFTRTGSSQRTDIAYYTMPKEETIKKSGKFTAGKSYGPIQILGAILGAATPKVFDNKLSLFDAAGTDENIKLEISKIEQTAKNSVVSAFVSSGTSKDGVIYQGPELFHHIQTTGGSTGKGWGDFMNKYSVSPKVFESISEPDERINGTFTLTWKNVKFPEDGDYRVKFQADNIGVLKIGDKEVQKTTDFYGDPTTIQTNITAGTYDITIELTNIKDRTNKFSNNPTGTSLIIEKDISVRDSLSKSWTENPIGVSAVLISPPCPKKISGRGVVEKIIIDDPGNGYLKPQDPTISLGYPVIVKLKEVLVDNGGINYNCGGDQLKISPDNGAKLSYTCNAFGVINTVTVDDPGTPFTTYPRITLPSETGVNVKFTPVFEVIRDPLDPTISPNNIIQVTDLVGLKQTGYVEGRPYYGAVYYEGGIRYAGYYKTIGTPIVVYNTLQESITAKVTTPASAIERSGTDVTSNDPRLNIPGTPENLI